MTIIIDRELLKRVEDVFKTLGMAALELQLFTNTHPRYQKTLQGLKTMLEEFFEKSPRSSSLTITLRRDQAEFRRIPLVNAGSHGKKFIATLRKGDIGGLQLKKGLSDEDVSTIVETINRWAKSPEDRTLPPEGRFNLLSPARVQELMIVAEGRSGVERLEFEEDAELVQLLQSGTTPEMRLPEVFVPEVAFKPVVDAYRNQLSILRGGRSFDYGTLRETTSQVTALFAEGVPPVFSTDTKSYFDDFTFHHSVNVCLLSTMIARKLVSDPEVVQQIANAALLHDLGKSKIPEEILFKPGPLTQAERTVLEEHPVVGAEMLLSVEHIDPLSVAVAFGHHMHDGANSYPKTRSPFTCDWVTQMVGVVDIYEALTAIRPYKAGLTSETAFNVMLKMPGLKNRVHFIKLLYECLGPYPPGCLLELGSGALGLSLEHNPDAPYLPRIRMLTSPDRTVLSTPEEIDLSLPDTVLSDGTAPTIVRQLVAKEPIKDFLDVTPAEEPRDILGAPLNDDKALMSREG